MGDEEMKDPEVVAGVTGVAVAAALDAEGAPEISREVGVEEALDEEPLSQWCRMTRTVTSLTHEQQDQVNVTFYTGKIDCV